MNRERHVRRLRGAFQIQRLVGQIESASIRQPCPAAALVELQLARDRQMRGYAGDLRLERHHARRGIAARSEQMGHGIEGAGLQLHAQVQFLTLGRGNRCSTEKKVSEIMRGAIGARRCSGKAQLHRSTAARGNIHIGVVEKQHRFGLAELEIHASGAHFDGGQLRGSRTACGSGRRTVEEKLEVPGAFVGLHEVERGITESQARKIQPSAQQAERSDARIERLHIGEGLNAGPRIFMDGDAVERKSRRGKRRQIHIFYVDAPSQSAPQRPLDAGPQKIERHVHGGGGHHREHHGPGDPRPLHCSFSVIRR